ncbi:uncharacterized protein RJT20DRAFT_10932 [Scheffersomyces xylosifermentans]|uniref:uncharacterized protein n=1 Tax=Scheffersomyces xylosifermentans TaxID=1304137 RepID=UPI00315D12BD
MMLTIGSKVSVKDESGVVRFIGPTEFAAGEWYGIELDRPNGRNDGSVNDIRYFSTSKSDGKYGLFVREALLSQSRASSTSPRLESPRLARPSVDDPSHLHNVIDKLQSKLRNTSGEIREYKEKLSAIEQELIKRDKSITALESQLEMQTVDHDFLVASTDGLQSQLEELQMKYDELKTDYSLLQEEAELNKQLENEINSSFSFDEFNEDDVQKIILRNKQLESALVSLQQFTTSKESDMSKEIKELTARISQQEASRSDFEAIQKKLTVAEETINTLREKLESTLDLEKVVEHLSSENEELSKKVENLTKTIDEFNELHELDISLEESHTIVEQELKNNLSKLSEVIKLDKITIQELEKRNRFMEERLKGLQIDEPSTNDESTDQLIQEIELLKVQLAASKSSNRAERVSAQFAEFKLSSLQESLQWDHSVASDGVWDAIYHMKCCIFYVKELKQSWGRQDKSSYLSQLRQHTSTILIKQLEMLLQLWESNYNNESVTESSENLVDVLIKLESNLISINSTSYEDEPTFISPILNLAGDLMVLLSQLRTSDLEHFNRYCFMFQLSFIHSDSQISGRFLNDIVLHKWLKGKTDSDFENKISSKVTSLSKECASTELLSSEVLDRLSKSDEMSDIVFANSEFDMNTLVEDVTMSNQWHIRRLDFCINGLVDESHSILENTLTEIEDRLNKYKNRADTVYSIRNVGIHSIYEARDKSDKQPSEVEVIDADALKAELEDSKVKISEKDRQLNEYQLNIKLLEKNMESLNSMHISAIQEVKSKLSKLHLEYEESKNKIEDLTLSNAALEKEIEDLAKSREEFDFQGKFTSMQSESKAIDRLALIEEIVLLRKVANQVFQSTVAREDNLGWLKNPIGHTKIPVDHRSMDFHNCGRQLQELALRTVAIKTSTSGQKWLPKANFPKYVNLSLKESLNSIETQLNAIQLSLSK